MSELLAAVKAKIKSEPVVVSLILGAVLDILAQVAPHVPDHYRPVIQGAVSVLAVVVGRAAVTPNAKLEAEKRAA